MATTVLSAEYASAMTMRGFREAAERERMFGLVVDHQIRWSVKVGVAGGFVPLPPSPPLTPAELIALHHLARAGRIEITGTVVSITAAGRAHGGAFTGDTEEVSR